MKPLDLSPDWLEAALAMPAETWHNYNRQAVFKWIFDKALEEAVR